MRCSREKICEPRSDIPVPRLSNKIRRQNDASCWKNLLRTGDVQFASTFDTKPGTKTTSIGPLPTTW
jgi:hypothetical protein